MCTNASHIAVYVIFVQFANMPIWRPWIMSIKCFLVENRILMEIARFFDVVAVHIVVAMHMNQAFNGCRIYIVLTLRVLSCLKELVVNIALSRRSRSAFPDRPLETN